VNSPAPFSSDDPSTRWDLSSLFESPDDPRREAEKDEALRRTEAFGERYRGKVATLDGPALREALDELAAIRTLVVRHVRYASLRYAVDTEDGGLRAEHAAAQVVMSTMNQGLAFLGVELAALSEEHFAGLEGADQLTELKWWIDQELLFAPYTLSEEAERTIARKNVTAKQAWVDLYMQTSSSLSFPMEIDGEVKELTRSEVSSLRLSADRDVRRRAMASLVDTFSGSSHPLTFCFNTLFEDHRSEMAERGYPDVLHYTVLRDGLTPEIVRALIDTTTQQFPAISHRWHGIRKRVLGIEDYGFEDTYHAIFGEEPESAWPEARELVVQAFEAFDSSAGEWAQKALDDGWVDVYPRPGKRAGAFCSSAVAPDHSFVMLNHAGKLDDTFTLAHEFGHAYHFTLAQKQHPLNFHCGTPLAETASIFAELWLHEHLMASGDATLKKQLLARQIDDAMGSAIRQITYINFELAAHARRAEGVATDEEYSAIWLEELRRAMGPDVQLDPERDGWWWIMVPHFIFARFYCYAYAFGKLLTLSLFGLWRQRGDEFVAQYQELLGSGGSRPPAELVDALGLDLADPEFWQRGLDVLSGYMDQLEELLD